MRPMTLLRLAFSGSVTDRVRAGLTIIAAFPATLGLLATATVLNMAPTSRVEGGHEISMWRYTTVLLNEMGMRPGLVVMVAAGVIPALILIVHAARLGGPARDRRLASMRLAGASPTQCRVIAAAEQGVTVGIGALLGLAAFPLLHRLLHRPTPVGTRQAASAPGEARIDLLLLPLPTDTWPQAWIWPLVALGLPVVAGLLSTLALRRVTSPDAGTGLRRHPRLWPGLAVVGGLAGMAVCRVWTDSLHDDRRRVVVP